MDISRYDRQINLDFFGENAQEKLKNSNVCVIGAGGVGSACIPLLVGVGIGNLSVIDCDVVSLTNLHRQTIYRQAQVGEPKVEKLLESLSDLNEDSKISIYNKEILNEADFEFILKDAHICIDATDSFKTRFLISKLAKKLSKKLIYSSAQNYDSQIILFGENFYLADFIKDDSIENQEAQKAPIYPPSAHFSGVMAASICIKALALDKYNVADFISYNHHSNKHLHINLRD